MPVTGLHTGHVQRAGKRSAQEPGRPGCEGVAEPHGCRREYITAGARTKPIGTILKICSKIGSSINRAAIWTTRSRTVGIPKVVACRCPSRCSRASLAAVCRFWRAAIPESHPRILSRPLPTSRSVRSISHPPGVPHRWRAPFSIPLPAYPADSIRSYNA